MKYPSYRSSGLPSSNTVPIEHTSIVFKHKELNRPGWLNDHRNVHTEARISSTYMPAAEIAMRCHLFGSIQESDTLQAIR